MSLLQSNQGALFKNEEYDYEAGIEQCAAALNRINSALADNIFISPSDAEHIRSVAGEIMKQIALTRADISELLYG